MLSADRLQADYLDGIFHSQQHYFEQTAAAYQRLADSDGYRANPPARAAALSEAARYAAWATKSSAWTPPGTGKKSLQR